MTGGLYAFFFRRKTRSIATIKSAPYSGEHFFDIVARRVVSTCICRRYVAEGLRIVIVKQGWSFQTSWIKFISSTFRHAFKHNQTKPRHNAEAHDINPHHCENLDSITLSYCIANRISYTSNNLFLSLWDLERPFWILRRKGQFQGSISVEDILYCNNPYTISVDNIM
jgi:hypothetical protein